MFDTKSLIPWAGAGPSTLVRLVAGQLASYNAASGVWTSTSAILWSNACVSVSNGHSVKHRPRIARNQDERLFPSRRYACPLARPLHRTCFWKRQIDVNRTLPFEEGAAMERRGGRRGHQQGMVDFERLSKFWVAESYRVAAAKHFLRILSLRCRGPAAL